ncbi:unnamed protein product [Orchesella dallaii]|uniref:Gustatory receptor n=1 Tax=Orchesella dallaii TaxID=48710 RepID=A0ABP1REA5_9HEXA
MLKTRSKSIKGSDIIFVVNSTQKTFANLQIHSEKSGQGHQRQQNYADILRTYLMFAYCLCISPFRIVNESSGCIVAKRWTLQSISLNKLVALLCLAYVCLGFVSAILGSELMESRIWTPSFWARCLALEGRYNFFTGPESNCNETMLYSLENISTGDHIMAGFTAFGQLFKFITSFYWELLILFGVLSLWLPAAAFAEGFKDENDDDDEDEDERNSEEKILEAAAQWPCIEEQYLCLKNLSDLINNAFGAMVFSYTFSSIFYYSINLDAFLLTSDILKRIRLVVLYLGAVILYILAADVCRQVGYLETWLSEYADDESKSNVPFHRLTVILNELSTNTIGISGWNVFTVTYSVVANMTSVLITYFIICVQFRTDS